MRRKTSYNKFHAPHSAALRGVAVVLRVLVGAVFVFSGVVKAVDPYGTAIKIGEYLHAMGLGWLDGASGVASVALVSVETMLGVALVVGALPRLVSGFVLIFNLFYTALTLWLAVANPISDCGCFGDVVVMTNWQTFWKNVALTLASGVVWVVLRGEKGKRWSAWCSLGVLLATVGVATYGLVQLPLVEKFPFGEGVDLRALLNEEEVGTQGKVVCRNKATDEVESFDVNDPTWWDESVWEFVATEDTDKDGGDRVVVGARDFVLTDENGDMTADVVEYEGSTQIVCIQIFAHTPRRVVERLASDMEQALESGARVVVATASPMEEAVVALSQAGVDMTQVEVCNMDITTMQVFLRAPWGSVWLHDGVIERTSR